MMLAPGSGRSNSSAAAGSGDSLKTFCTMAPRRMFLCDVPLFFKQINADGSSNSGDGNVVRLMGTVVEVIQPTPLTSSDNCTTNSREVKNKTTSCMVHFVIDDGTALIGVFAKRRVNQKNNGIANASDERSLPTEQTQPPTMQNANHPQNNMHADNQTLFGKVSLESILSAPQKPILVGQAVDCIGRIQVDKHEAKANDGNCDGVPSPSSSQTLWLAASSVSIVNNPQAVTLRQIELSSSTRAIWSNSNNNNTNSNSNNTTRRRTNKPQNRILVGGELERKLNPLFHCTREGTVVFNMEDAFNYIKHSKDDGGITPSELALLVRAIEPSEKLAVNLAVEQLREDCRIYLNLGKWFPM